MNAGSSVLKPGKSWETGELVALQRERRVRGREEGREGGERGREEGEWIEGRKGDRKKKREEEGRGRERGRREFPI